jgi:hypothetical protein
LVGLVALFNEGVAAQLLTLVVLRGVSVHDAQVSHSCRDIQLSGSGNRAKEQHGTRGDTWDSVKMDCFMGVLEIELRQDPLITSDANKSHAWGGGWDGGNHSQGVKLNSNWAS